MGGQGFNPADKDAATHLDDLKLLPSLTLSVRDGQIRQQRRVSDNRSQCIPVLMREPFAAVSWDIRRSPRRGSALEPTHYLVMSGCPVPVYRVCTAYKLYPAVTTSTGLRCSS